MSVTLNATSCPAPQVLATVPTLAAAESTTATAAVARGVQGTTGMTTGTINISPLWNRNAQTLDLTSYFGPGGIGICYGLTLTASGLTTTVAAGLAAIGGLVELASTTAALSDASDNWIWLLQTGVLSVRANVITAPAGAACCLGMLRTVAGAVTLTDYSGVVYLRFGELWRQTADAGVPGDTPNAALRLVTQTAGGDWRWNGTRYISQGGVEVRTTDPGSPVRGQIWYRSDTDAFKVYTGSATKSVTLS